ncbi:hypothetical protein [Roseiconus lacunae]|uniref:Uncharacterized protein n=1 Tax=Roseiconus lacunae TaxID=2605694 RepID=A0ABT7PFK3_9BACT|nr:hypothetical protein [Roseiconus lacunae]MDM4015269.1 hypothetical protein [Roseiconus lacunae]
MAFLHQNRFTASDFKAAPPPTPKVPATLPAIIAAEPIVGAILKSYGPKPFRRHRWLAYESGKRELSRLVGWEAKNPALRTSAHWDIVISALAKRLGV